MWRTWGGFVKSSFFKVRRFYHEEDLRQQLRDWHHEVNEERACRATGIIPALRLAEEAPHLRALKVQPEQLALRIPVYVGPTGTVLHDGHAYSMPPEAISMEHLPNYSTEAVNRRYRRWFRSRKNSDYEEMRRLVKRIRRDGDRFLQNFLDATLLMSSIELKGYLMLMALATTIGDEE